VNFCSNCGSPDLKFSIPEGDSLPRFWCPNCNTIHYQNPRLIVGTLTTFEDKVLLCKRAIEPRYGLWNLPAGFLENGETAEAGALRETWEEAFAKPKLVRLHCVYSLPHVNQVYLHFLARLEKPEFSSGPESLEVKLLTEEEIPWGEIAFTSTSFALKKYFEFRHQADFHGVHIGMLDRKN